MRFKAGVPFVTYDPKTKKYVLKTFSRFRHYHGPNRTYMSFRYYAACRFFDRLAKGEFPNWPQTA